ncbi:protein NYNRIN-like [Gossypium australe]|uniref:Protein NYNRIN-like n=1 Tax=Gossypium australe TaxID=47621 RepID=A0A5B6VCR4_9ROSI|nr:protein NYNRIN-like [Gossypium australe]
MDWINVEKNLLLELNEMEDFRSQAYENAKLYKEKTKRRHDKKLLQRHLIGQAHSRVYVYPDVVVEVKDGKTDFNFQVNGQRLKHYWGATTLRDEHSIALQIVDFGLCFVIVSPLSILAIF